VPLVIAVVQVQSLAAELLQAAGAAKKKKKKKIQFFGLTLFLTRQGMGVG